MDLLVNAPFKILQINEAKNLPDFIVLTGENGSGKSQLLNLIAYGHGDGAIKTVESNHSESFEDVYVPNCELRIGGKITTNIILVLPNDNTIYLGDHISEASIIARWGSLPHKYLSFLNIKFVNNRVTREAFDSQFRSDVGYQHQSQVGITPISDIDLQILEAVYQKRGRSSTPATLKEIIVLMDPPVNAFNSANLSMLYLQYLYRMDLGMEIIEAPWETFNKAMEAAKFKYRLIPPVFDQKPLNINITMVDIEKGGVIESIEDLSSGEKTIMSLVLALYNSKNDTQFPDVILYDEPDAYLHPSMVQQLLNVMMGTLVKDKGVKVVVTTHSPTTVALTPPLSIYGMDREKGHIIKIEKDDAIKSLTEGLTTLSVLYEHKKQVFVEAKFDQYFYNTIYNIVREAHLNHDIFLNFVQTGSDQSGKGGCSEVKSIVTILTNNGNKSVCGLIDGDLHHVETDRIKILGNNSRYSIENYVLDPIFIAILLLSEQFSGIDLGTLGFPLNATVLTFESIDDLQLQNIIDNIISKVRPFAKTVSTADNLFPAVSGRDTEAAYYLINGKKFKVPQWFLITKGHLLEDMLLLAFKPLISIARDGKGGDNLKTKIVAKAIKLFPSYLSKDLLETFIKLEQIPIS